MIGCNLVVDVGIRSEHLRSIEAIIRCIHHVGQLRHSGDTQTNVGIDAGSHRVATFGGDEYHTVTTFCTIKSCSVLENLNLIDIVRVDAKQEVVVVAIVYHFACRHHVAHDTVNHEERLRIGVKRVESTDEHRSAIAWTAIACHCTHISTDVILNIHIHTL